MNPTNKLAAVAVIGLINSGTLFAQKDGRFPVGESDRNKATDTLPSNKSGREPILSVVWMDNNLLHSALYSFGRAWKVYLCCETTLDARYSEQAIKDVGECAPAFNEGPSKAPEALRRLLPDFKVSFAETKPPVVFVEDTRLKRPLLRRIVDLPAYDGNARGLTGLLYNNEVYVSLPIWRSMPDFWAMDWSRKIRVPAMKTTLGSYLAAALLDERVGHGVCFYLVTSPIGVYQITRSCVVNGRPGQFTMPVESIIYVPPPINPGGESKDGKSK